ncbi:MAG: hypothetical protein V3W18_09570 [candidate division Zixibacteria bacterium]
MRTISILAGILLFSSAVAWSGAAGLVNTNSVENQLIAGSLTMEKYFDRESIVRQGDDLELTEDIYDYGSKSPFKAFMLSLAVPGAGEYYAGKKYRAVGFLTADILFWSGYFIYHSKGVSTEKDYQAYADDNYNEEDYLRWWNMIPDSTKEIYSHSMPVDENGIPIRNHEYYENIGKYNQFQVGWQPDGWNNPFLPNSPDSTYHKTYMPYTRETYLDMRKDSNDYFAKATTMMMISIANHIVSAFDAAIGAKRFNRGSKQYSMKVNAREINGVTTPFLTLSAKF